MSARLLLCRTLPRSWSCSPSVRYLSSRIVPPWVSSSSPYHFNLKWARIGVASGAAVLATSYLLAPALHADAEHLDEKTGASEAQKPLTPISSFIRTYVVYYVCSFPSVVDWSPNILSFCMSIPVLKQITEAVVRITFFDQFVGGDSAEEALPVMENLRSENKGALLVYSVEVDEEEASGKTKVLDSGPVHKRSVQEIIHSIEVAADFEDRYVKSQKGNARGTVVAVKLSALLPNAQSLVNLSKHIVRTRPPVTPSIPFPGCPHATDLDVLRSPSTAAAGSGLTEQDVVDLKDLHQDLIQICAVAQKRGIRIIVDAEHSWYTPAIDAFTLTLMRQFNRLPDTSSGSEPNVQPLVYNTYQGYLRRTPGYIAQSIADAKAGNYSIGIKLVRGAYHSLETSAHAAHHAGSKISLSISPDDLPPVWSTKHDTDECYNSSVKVILENVAKDIATTKSPSSLSTIVTRARSFSFRSLFSKPSTVTTIQDVSTAVSPPPTIGALFGTHNRDSCKLILDTLVENGLATTEGHTLDGEPIIKIPDEVVERVTLAQLYGMSDALTNYIVDHTKSSTPIVLKYLPYGALAEVMPYLSRRAIENKSVLGNGGAADERKRAAAEIKKRLFG